MPPGAHRSSRSETTRKVQHRVAFAQRLKQAFAIFVIRGVFETGGMMRTAIAICAGLAMLAGSAAAEEDAPSWHVVVGMGAMAHPAYPGARSLSVLPLPLLDVRYGDLFFASVMGGVGLTLIAERAWHAGFAISPRLGRSDSSDARLRGWGSITAGADARIFADYRLGPVSLGASVHRELEGSEGMLADATAAWFVPLSPRFFVSAKATLTCA